MTFRKEPELPLGLTTSDLPAWMRRSRREIDWAFLAVLVMGVVIVWPLIMRPGLPRNEGIQSELARTIEIAESIQSGVIYPRWASNFNYGYGSPIWNHLPPLPHYLTGLHYILAQSNPEISIKLVLISCILLGGIGMFSFARRRWGVYGGLLAAALYFFNPQLALVKPYLQSDLPVMLAMGLFPVVLWAFDRLLALGRGRDLGLAACLLAALWLTSVPLNILLTVLLVGWLIWNRFVIRPEQAFWGRASLGLICGIGMSAFYWLPAWAEHHAVQWKPVGQPLLNVEQSLSLAEIFAPPHLLDLSAINPAPTNALGVAVWIFAALALGMVVSRAWQRTLPPPYLKSRGEVVQWRLLHFLRCTTPQERETLYFAAVGGIVLLTLVQTSWWSNSPLAWSPLASHDILSIVIACWAIAAAQIGHRLGQTLHVFTAAGILMGGLVVILVTALPVLYPPVWPERHFVPDLSTVLLDEARGYTAGSKLTGVLVPHTVRTMPALSRMLIESYQSQMVDKVARDLLPPATQVDIIEHRPQSERLVTRSSNETVLTLLTFNYPGWRVKIDNNAVPIRTESTSGFITFEIPAGRHEVEVYFGTTSPRVVGWSFALAALLGVGIVGWRLEYLQRQRGVLSPMANQPLRNIHYAVFLMAVLTFGLGGMLPRLVPEWFTMRSSRGEVEPAEHFALALQGGIDLLGYEVENNPGDEIKVTLYWRAVRPDLPDYQVNMAVVSEDDPQRQVDSVQHRHPGMIPSSQWSAWPLLDSYVRDVYYISLPDDVTPGQYQIIAQVGPCNQAALFPCETIDPLFVRDGRGAILGQRIILPAVIELTADN